MGPQALLAFFFVRFVRFVFQFLSCFSNSRTPQYGSASLATTTFAGLGSSIKNPGKGLILAPMG